MDLDHTDHGPLRSASAPVEAAAEPKQRRRMSRRTLLKVSAGAGLATAGTAALVDALVVDPQRLSHAAPSKYPDIQYDIGAYIPPAQSLGGVMFRFGPVYVLFLTMKLTREPQLPDRILFDRALGKIEATYHFNPSGVIPIVSWGLPYFSKLKGGLTGQVVSNHMPRLLSDPSRYALEEAVPSPTDVHPSNPGVRKKTFNVPLVIEDNDLLLSLRSDNLDILSDVANWLQGSDTLKGKAVASPQLPFQVTSSRLEFVQLGLPRKIGDRLGLPYATRLNPQSPMWFGYADQNATGAGPAAITTFQGNASARVTNITSPADYFYNGSIQPLNHNIEDLMQWFFGGDTVKDNGYAVRTMYMYRGNPVPEIGFADQFTDGGGPAFIENIYAGAKDAESAATGANMSPFDSNEPVLGHLQLLQRSSRAPDGTPMHIRMDGPGFDSMDVPDGTPQPKLHFSGFFPSADFFNTMRKNGASLDLVNTARGFGQVPGEVGGQGVEPEDDGIERFITATRRQNFLCPPRRHRSFPLIELSR